MKLFQPFPRPTDRPLAYLALLMVLGAGLRFWQLPSKPLWLDEIITALISLGQSSHAIPLNQLVPLETLTALFSPQPDRTCQSIAQVLTADSTHPPLFFCALSAWLGGLLPWGVNWVWALRSLPAVLGVVGIAAAYGLGRVVGTIQTGLVTALIVTVSPFAVYLSQEARHYTLPMLWITLALIGLVQIQQDLQQAQGWRPWVWLGWVLANLLGLYTHYFMVLAIAAQVGALVLWLGWQNWQHRQWHRRAWAALGLAIAGIGLGYLPWLATLVQHLGRDETRWLTPYDPDWVDRLEPLVQTLVGWVLMVVALPVEQQPWFIAIPLGGLMLGVAIGLIRAVIQGARHLRQTPQSLSAIALIALYVAIVQVEFFVIIYVLNQDITSVPRYNFIHFPGICLVIAAGLLALPRVPAKSPSRFHPWITHPIAVLTLIGLMSSGCVVTGWVFQKPYLPDTMARDMRFEPEQPIALIVSYQSLQEIALGLSIALELRSPPFVAPVEPAIAVGFVHRDTGYRRVWRDLSRWQSSITPPLNLWVVASPGMKTEDYPLELTLQSAQAPITCAIAPTEFHRIGFPYQLFRCH